MVKKFGRLLSSLADLRDAAKVAQLVRQTAVLEISPKVDFGRVLELLLVEVKDEHFVPQSEEMTGQATANALGSFQISSINPTFSDRVGLTS